jgi:DNA-binding NarL/FixJ family response regulator
MVAGEPIRVLIVDDSEDARFLVSVLLEDEPDIELVGSVDGARSALAFEAATAPDVALVDARMPLVDGFALTPQLHERWPSLAVVLLTSLVDPHVVAQALQAGAVACEAKGDWDRLGDVVRGAAGR